MVLKLNVTESCTRVFSSTSSPAYTKNVLLTNIPDSAIISELVIMHCRLAGVSEQIRDSCCRRVGKDCRGASEKARSS